MKHSFEPVLKQSLPDRLARQIRGTIQSGNYRRGDRLPPIVEMAKRFEVGQPSIREALKKLEAMGVVQIRHGAGVFVTRSEEVLVLASPDYAGTVTKKLLLDLIHARIPIESQSAADAVRNATPEQLVELRRILAEAGQNLGDDEVLNSVNMEFHSKIAQASGNSVTAQLLNVLHELFTDEQRLILGIFGSREADHQGHLEILDAIERRDETLAVERMRAHLESVQAAILRWNPEDHPVAVSDGLPACGRQRTSQRRRHRFARCDMHARLRRLGLPLLLLCGACASSHANARHRVDMSVLTQDDLVDHQYENVLEAVQTLRSNWLNERGPDSFASPSHIWVYIDNTQGGRRPVARGDLDALHRVRPQGQRHRRDGPVGDRPFGGSDRRHDVAAAGRLAPPDPRGRATAPPAPHRASSQLTRLRSRAPGGRSV